MKNISYHFRLIYFSLSLALSLSGDAEMMLELHLLQYPGLSIVCLIFTLLCSRKHTYAHTRTPFLHVQLEGCVSVGQV